MLFAVVSSPASSSVPALAKISASVNPDSSSFQDFGMADHPKRHGPARKRKNSPTSLRRQTIPRADGTATGVYSAFACYAWFATSSKRPSGPRAARSQWSRLPHVHRLVGRRQLPSGAALPEHWFGGGGDVNRATAAEMDAPTMKALAQERDLWTEILRRCASYVIWRRLDPAGMSPPDPEEFDADIEPMAEWPEMVERDLSRHATSLPVARRDGRCVSSQVI